MIKVTSLSKFYGSKQVLKEVNLDFLPGIVCGIVGENGSGKTTLFQCIAGLIDYRGKITSHYSNLKDHLGFLQTDPYFFSKITGREYLNLLCISRKNKLVNVDEKNIFDLPLEQYASTYSTGMKKKLALLGVLIQSNEILILDEPFNGVDIQSNIIITEIIHKLKKLGKTVIISSHIFSTLNDTCDAIYLLKDGKLIKKVMKEEFEELENEIKDFSIGNQIDKLDLE
jgi:ABC-2 type transport system ATP-binding protein